MQSNFRQSGRVREGDFHMIKNSELLEKFERKVLQKEKLDYRPALRIFESMWREGMALGVLPLKDPLEGIEVDIRIARMLNHV